MPRYVIERTFSHALAFRSRDDEARAAYADMIERNAEHGVTWLHSYVTPDRTKAFCVCDAPTPEALRMVALRNQLPVDRITEVRVLDPYFHG